VKYSGAILLQAFSKVDVTLLNGTPASPEQGAGH
jgi:hypothetical protein